MLYAGAAHIDFEEGVVQGIQTSPLGQHLVPDNTNKVYIKKCEAVCVDNTDSVGPIGIKSLFKNVELPAWTKPTPHC